MKRILTSAALLFLALTLPSHAIYWWFTGTSVTEEDQAYNEQLEKYTPIYTKNYLRSGSRLFDGGLAKSYSTPRISDKSISEDTTNYRTLTYYKYKFFDPQNPPRDHAEIRAEAQNTDDYKQFLENIKSAEREYNLAQEKLTRATNEYEFYDKQYNEFEAARPPQVSRAEIQAAFESGQFRNDDYLFLTGQIKELKRIQEAKKAEIKDAQTNLTELIKVREKYSLYYRALEAREDTPPAYTEQAATPASSPRPTRPGEVGSPLDSEIFDNYDGVIAQLRSALGEAPLESPPSYQDATDSPPAYEESVDAPPSYEQYLQAVNYDLDDYENALRLYLNQLNKQEQEISRNLQLAQRDLNSYINSILEQTNFKEPNPFEANWNTTFNSLIFAKAQFSLAEGNLITAQSQANHFISNYIEAEDRKHMLTMRLSIHNTLQSEILPKNLDFYNFVFFGNSGIWSYRDWDGFFYLGGKQGNTSFKFEVIDPQGKLIFEKNDIPFETQSFNWSRSGFGQTIEFEILIDIKEALYPIKVESSGYIYNDWEDQKVLEVHADFIPKFQD